MEVDESNLPFSQLLFPFGSFELIFNLLNAPVMKMWGENTSFTQPDILFPGQFTNPFELSFNKKTKCFGISFQPWTGNLLLKIPAYEFTDKIVQLNDNNPLRILREQFLGSKDENEFIMYLESYLYHKIKTYQEDHITTFLAKTIILNQAPAEIKKISESLCICQRRIEQRFSERIGLPIRTFTRKVRFQKAVNLLKQPGCSNLTGIGLEAGYYDQNHFIRDFKQFSGHTPKAFTRNRSALQDFVCDLQKYTKV